MDSYSARKKRRKERNLQFSIDPIRPDLRPRPKGLLEVAQNSCQLLDFDGSLWTLFNTGYNHGIKKLPNHWLTQCYHFREAIGYHSNSMTY